MIQRLLLPGILLVCMPAGLAPTPALAQSTAVDLSTTSLETLTQMQISVTSFARKDENLWVTPAAVFVITHEDIEHSAATSIPELLRMVPGLQVAQIDAATWAVSVRGFNSAYANKLLVLVDGRTLYSEIYSGSHWDQNDMPLENIERIEVIRGPGAAVWGTNAVNGVINIITRRARSTTGIETSAQLGRIDETVNLRYGGSVGDHLQYRADAYYINREPFKTADGNKAFDGEDSVRGAGRVDWQPRLADWITLSGDIYGGHLKQQLRPEFALPVGPNGEDTGSINGGYLLSRWEHKQPHADMALQLYYDDTARHELSARARTETFDVEYQDHLAAGRRNDLVWGTGYRFTSDRIRSTPLLTRKEEYENYLVSGFAQDEISLVPKRLVLTLGSKIQDGTLAGFQIQPSARILWAPTSTQSVWAAVSRAAVAPSLQDKQILIPLDLGTEQGLPVEAALTGNPAFKPETVVAYEAGYRRRLPGNLILDLATFFNANRRIQSLTAQTPAFVPLPSPHLFTTLVYGNGYRANAAGVELSVSWKPVPLLSFQGSYAWMQAHITPASAGTSGLVDTWSTPRNTLALSSTWTIAPHWNLSAFVYHVDALPPEATSVIDPTLVPSVPDFTRLDLHLAHRLGRFVEIDAGGTNLLRPAHTEFGGASAAIVPGYVPRSLFLKFKWTF